MEYGGLIREAERILAEKLADSYSSNKIDELEKTFDTLQTFDKYTGHSSSTELEIDRLVPEGNAKYVPWLLFVLDNKLVLQKLTDDIKQCVIFSSKQDHVATRKAVTTFLKYYSGSLDLGFLLTVYKNLKLLQRPRIKCRGNISLSLLHGSAMSIKEAIKFYSDYWAV